MFLGPEMQQLMLSKSKTGKVDLYYNDVYACGELLEMIAQSILRNQLKKCREISSEQCPGMRRSARKSVLVSTNPYENMAQIFEVEEEKPESAFERLDCYEFYTVVYAATALNEHDFNLRENLPRLTPQQKSYVYNILVKCLNRAKMERVIEEL
mgnify:CR=1 FL=1